MDTEFLKALEEHSKQDDERFQHLEDKLDKQPTKEDFDVLSKKIDSHMQAIEPFMQAVAGFGWIAKGAMFIGSAILLWEAIKGVFGFK